MQNRAIKNIALGLIAILIFTFVHSELDQFSVEDDNHIDHDFCQLVSGTTLQINKISISELVKFTFGKIFYSKAIKLFIQCNSYYNLSDFYKPPNTKITTHKFVIFQSFLI